MNLTEVLYKYLTSQFLLLQTLTICRSDPRNHGGTEISSGDVETSEVVSYSPPETEERHRLGTEDSGFGGDAVVTNVVGMLLDAANEDDDDRSRHSEQSKPRQFLLHPKGTSEAVLHI